MILPSLYVGLLEIATVRECGLFFGREDVFVIDAGQDAGSRFGFGAASCNEGGSHFICSQPYSFLVTTSRVAPSSSQFGYEKVSFGVVDEGDACRPSFEMFIFT